MGKLHSLRKQIEKDPEEWYKVADMSETIFGKIPIGAARVGNHWVPISRDWRTELGRNPNSYVMFVRRVLWDLGIKTDKPRSVRNVRRRDNNPSRHWASIWR
jgi:hypothetical protein